jgi:hypothetical protein
LYALCNGKSITIFSISDYEPLVEIDLCNLNEQWEILEKYLKPEYIERPYLADFHPDLGMTLLKLNNTAPDFIFPNIWMNGIIKVSDNLYTINSALKYGEEDFMASFDFDKNTYDNLLSIIPDQHAKAIRGALSRQPYLANFNNDHLLELNVVAKLTNEIIKSEMTSESFVPFSVIEFSME